MTQVKTQISISCCLHVHRRVYQFLKQKKKKQVHKEGKGWPQFRRTNMQDPFFHLKIGIQMPFRLQMPLLRPKVSSVHPVNISNLKITNAVNKFSRKPEFKNQSNSAKSIRKTIPITKLASQWTKQQAFKIDKTFPESTMKCSNATFAKRCQHKSSSVLVAPVCSVEIVHSITKMCSWPNFRTSNPAAAYACTDSAKQIYERARSFKLTET